MMDYSRTIGMATIGVGAELLGTRAALLIASVLGLVALGAIVLRRRDLLGPNPKPAAPEPT